MKKIISLLVLICFLAEQSCFAQVLPQVLPLYFTQPSFLIQDKFRPIHLRSIEFTPQPGGVQVLLDTGDSKELKQDVLQEEAGKLMEYFLTGLTLPNSSFWVNLRPDQADNIIDPYLEKTDIGKVMLAADLNLKKDLAKATSPQTREGKEYWDKLYAKAQELFGDQQVSLPTFTRPWIVPAEIIIRQSKNNSSGVPANAYIYKATLKVMLEQDYLRVSAPRFEDKRLKELNDYSSELIRRLIIPKLTLKVNSSKTYAPLRQVYYSLILAQWMKEETKNGSGASVPGSGNNEKQSTVLKTGSRLSVLGSREETEGRGMEDKGGGTKNEERSLANALVAGERQIPATMKPYVDRIDTKDLNKLTSQQFWSKDAYFKQYKQSFQKGEYFEYQTINTPYGQTIRQYTSGGITFQPVKGMITLDGGGNLPQGHNLVALNYDIDRAVPEKGQRVILGKHERKSGPDNSAGGQIINKVKSLFGLEYALDFDLVKVIEEDGFTIRRVKLPTNIADKRIQSRVDLLKNELVRVAGFQLSTVDLLYQEGRLLAIFPVFPDDIARKFVELPSREIRYLNLAPYYFAIPEFGAPGARESWESFAKQLEADMRIVYKYKNRKSSAVKYEVNHSQSPYFYAQVDMSNGEIVTEELFSVNEDRYTFRSPWVPLDKLPGREQIIIPVLPTVYSMSHHWSSDKEYYKYLAGPAQIKSTDKVLVIGPGTGVELWIANLFSREKKYAIGKNPIEKENVELTARVGGFSEEIEVITADNIISSEGEPRFKDIKFDKVLWNMPNYNPYTKERVWKQAASLPMRGDMLWDNDFEGEILRRFSQGLPSMLSSPDGRAILWNVPYLEKSNDDQSDVVEAIIKTGGMYKGPTSQTVKVLDVHRGRSATVKYGSLYIVSWPKADGGFGKKLQGPAEDIEHQRQENRRWGSFKTFNNFNRARKDFREVIKLTVKKITEKYLREAERVLEIGSGLGELGDMLQPDIRNKIIQTDRSMFLLRNNRVKTPKVGVDVYHIPYKDGEMPAVVSYAALDTLFDLKSGVREIARVLKPGGIMINFLDLAPTQDVIMDSFPEDILFPSYAKFQGIPRLTYLRVNRKKLLDNLGMQRNNLSVKQLLLMREYIANPAEALNGYSNSLPIEKVSYLFGEFKKILDTMHMNYEAVNDVEFFKSSLEKELREAGMQIVISDYLTDTIVTRKEYSQVKWHPGDNLYAFHTGTGIQGIDPNLAPGEARLLSTIYVVVAKKPGSTARDSKISQDHEIYPEQTRIQLLADQLTLILDKAAQLDLNAAIVLFVKNLPKQFLDNLSAEQHKEIFNRLVAFRGDYWGQGGAPESKREIIGRHARNIADYIARIEESNSKTDGGDSNSFINRTYTYPAGNVNIDISNPNANYIKTSEGAVSVGMTMGYRALLPDAQDYPGIIIAPRGSWVGTDGANIMQIYFFIAANFAFHKRKTIVVCRPDQQERISRYLELGNPYYLPNIAGYSEELIRRLRREAIYLADRAVINEKLQMATPYPDMVDFVEFSDTGEANIGGITITDKTDGTFLVSDPKQNREIVLQSNDLKELTLEMEGVNKLSEIPELGVTFLGTSSGMDPNGLPSNQIIWAGEQHILVDVNAPTLAALSALGLSPRDITHIVITHMHEDHVAGLLSYMEWCKRNGHPIRLLAEPGIYELFREQAKQILNKDIDQVYTIEFLPLAFYSGITLGNGQESVLIESAPAFHGTPTMMLRFTYRGQTISHSSDTTFDPVRFEQILENKIPENIRAELKDLPGAASDTRVFDKDRADEISGFLLKENQDGRSPDIIIFEGGNAAAYGKNGSNHTTPFAIQKLPEEIQRKIFVNHTAKLPDEGAFMFKHAVPFSTVKVESDMGVLEGNVHDDSATNDGGIEKQNDLALDDGTVKFPVGDTIKYERRETDMEQSLEIRYRDAVLGYFSQLNDLEAEVKEEKLVPGTPPWMKAALNKYAGLIKGIMPMLEDSGQEITFVYPFEGADSIPALLRRTYHLNYEISDLDLGEETLKEVFGKEKRAEIINRDTPLDALEKSNYETVRNAIKGPCVFILKGFAGWAKKNKASTFNQDLLRFILADVLRAGDKVLILSKNDLELYNSLSEKLKTDFLKHEQYVFDGKPFFIGTKGINDDSWEKSIRLPNAVMILEKKPVTSARDGGEELRQRRAWLDDYKKALVVSSGLGFKPGEVNSPEVIRSITVIGGTPIADINKKAQKHAYSMSGFADDVIEQMVMDHQTVARLGTTHKELAGFLWMVVEKCFNREERFSYNGMDYRVKLSGSLGSQSSIFSNRFWWGALDDFVLINITQGTFQKFTSNSIAEIEALGFYESPVVRGAINEYAVDPELLWRMFKDKDYRKPYVSVEEALAERAKRIKKQEGWDSVGIYTLPQLKNVLPFVIRLIPKSRYQEEFYSESEKEKADSQPWDQTYVFEVRRKGPWTAIVRIGIRASDAVVENTGAKAGFFGVGVDIFRGNIPIYATNNFRPENLKKETGLDLLNILESFDRKEKTRITDDERWFYNELRFSASEQLGALFISAASKDLDYPSLLEDIFVGSGFLYKYHDFSVSYGEGKHFISLSRQIEIIKTLLCEAEERRSNANNTAVYRDNVIKDGGSTESFARFFDYLRLYGLKDTAWESKRRGQDEKQTSDFWQLIEEEMRATALFVEDTMGTYMRLKGVPLYMDLGLREIARSGFNPDVVVFLATEATPLEVCYRLLRERRGLKAPEYVVLEVHMPKSEGSDYGSLNKPEEEEKIRENIIRETKGIEIKGKQVLVIDATVYNGLTMGLTRDAFLSLGVTGLKTFSLMSPKFIPNYVPDYVGVCVENIPLMVWAKMLLNEGATNEVGKILAAVTFLYLNQTKEKEDRLLDKIPIAEPMGMKELRQGAKLLSLEDLKGNLDGGKSIAQDEGNRERARNEQNNLIQQVIDKLKPQLADSRYAERLLRKAKVDFELPLEGQWAIQRVVREAKAGTVFLYLPTIDIEDGDLPEKAAMTSVWGKPAVEKLKGKRPYSLNEVPFINEVIFPDNDVFLVSKSRNGVNATVKLGFLPGGEPVLVKTTIRSITIDEIKEEDYSISKCLLTKVVEELGFTAPLYGFFKDPSTGSISLVMDIINGDFPSVAGEFISANVTKDCIKFRKELRDLNLYLSDDLQPIIERSGRIKFIDDPIVTNDDAVAVAFQDEIFIRLISQILCAAQNQEMIEGSLKYFQEAYPELFHMLLASLEQKDEYAANVALQKAITQVKHLQGGIVSSVSKLKADGGKGGIDFRNLSITAQPVPVVQLGAQVSIQAKIPLAELDKEWSRIEEIVDKGSIPSGERIKEYVLSCCQKGDISGDVEKVLVCISEILRLEEDYALACEPGFVRLLSVLESDKPMQEMQVALSGISFSRK